MKHLFFDIETAPDLDKIKTLYPFTPVTEEEKLKELEREYKTQKTIDKHMEEFLSTDQEELFYRPIIDKSQLDPGLSYVCGVGSLSFEMIRDRDFDLDVPGQISKHIKLVDKDSEKEVLDELINKINHAEKVIGYNIVGFDLLYLWKRRIYLDISRSFYNADFKSRTKYVDLLEVWNNYSYKGDRLGSNSLESVVKSLGGKGKPGNGKDFYRYENDRKAEYLTYDIDSLVFLADKLGLVDLNIDGS